MEGPTLLDTLWVAPDTHALVAYLPVPGFGVLPVNAFLIRAAEPVLVDTGLAALRRGFLDQLWGLIAPEQLRWIWLTHTDPDHVGNLAAVLEQAPRARVVTNYLGRGKLALLGLPAERAHLVNPGQRLDLGDRRLTALRPPIYDAPETAGLFDSRTRALFSADCFGALLEAPAERAEAIDPVELREGLVSWAGVDAPWLHGTSAVFLTDALDSVRGLAPAVVLGSHLPPATGLHDVLLRHLAEARWAAPVAMPDQAALERITAGAVASA